MRFQQDLLRQPNVSAEERREVLANVLAVHGRGSTSNSLAAQGSSWIIRQLIPRSSDQWAVLGFPGPVLEEAGRGVEWIDEAEPLGKRMLREGSEDLSDSRAIGPLGCIRSDRERKVRPAH